MWASNASSAFVGGVRDSETALQSIGQYIEDYLDLVENVPNEIVRSISQLHEKSHVYHKLMEKLERALTKLTSPQETPDPNPGIVVDGQSGINVVSQGEEKKRKQFEVIQRYLVAIQSISDEKLYIVQSIYEQLELKGRQLEHDLRTISAGSGNSTLISPMKSPRDSARGYYAFNDRHSHMNGNVNNGLTSAGSESSPENNSSEENGSQDAASDHNGHDVVNGTSSSRRGGGDSRVNNNHNTSKNNGAINNHIDEDIDDNDADSESPTKERKRSRRTKNSRGDDSRDGPHRSDHNTSRGGKGGKRGYSARSKDHLNNSVSSQQHNTSSTHHHSISKKSRKRDAGSDSPDFLDDVDPNEPLYCLCNQISFGEMIGCDNNDCQIEWFHFSCVALTTKPKGKWYCPACRGDRSNIQRK